MFVVLSVVFCLMQSASGPPAGAAQISTPDAAAQQKLSTSQISELQSQADAGSPTAQVALGRAYQDGNGVAQNDALAANWYRKAADQGNPIAENNVGIMYRSGSGVEKSKEEAVVWYRKAARQKYPKAMFNIGTAFYNGDGVEIDDTAAFAWFLLAQEAGDKAADEAVQRMSKELVPDQRVEGQLKLAEMYKKGEDLNRDDGEAAKWYRVAAENGSNQAAIELASILIRGQGVPQDYAAARRLCEASAKKNYSPAAYCMGLIWRDGLGQPPDMVEAAKWFNRAADLQNSRAMVNLAEMYWKGVGVKPDKETAYAWVLLAASSGIPEAKQDQQAWQKEMDQKQIEQATAKAHHWVMTHRVLVVRSK